MFPHFVFQSLINYFSLGLFTIFLVCLVVFSYGVSILKPLLLNYLTSVSDQSIRFLYVVVLLLCQVFYMTAVVIYCFLLHIVGRYHSFIVQIIFLVFFFQRLLFCLYLFWMSVMSYRHTEELD